MPAPIKSYIDRILNVLAEIDDKQSDKKEIYKELAGDGFDRTVVAQVVGHIRKKAAKPGKVAEQAELFNLYLADYEGVGTFVATHAARESVDEDGVFIDNDERQADDKIAAAERTSARRAKAARAESAAKVDLKTTEPGMVPVAEADLHNPRNATASASHSEPTSNGTDAPVPSGAAEELPDSSAPIQAEEANEALEPLALDRTDPLRSADATREDAFPAAPDAPVSPRGDAAEGTGGDVRPSLVPTHNPETHFLNSKGLLRLNGCMNPEICGSSKPREKLCFSCSVRHEGPVYQADGEQRESVH